MREHTVAIIGASDKKEKYSNVALSLLKERGFTILPVNPSLDSIEGIHVFHSPSEINIKVDTVTLYINKSISSKIANEILHMKPGRIIFNPGSENDEFEADAKRVGITTIHACTIVMINTGQF